MDDTAREQKAIEEEQRRTFEQSVLPPLDISDLEERAKGGTIDDLAFEIFKETASIVTCCASAYIAHKPQDAITHPRNQAICIGLLVRLVKFMRAIMAIVSQSETWERSFLLYCVALAKRLYLSVT